MVVENMPEFPGGDLELILFKKMLGILQWLKNIISWKSLC